jgi:hypothetical protein
MIRLRPHHLLCILTYVGNGYTAPFVENFDAVTRRIASGQETVEIIAGPDDLCAPLACDADEHCSRASVSERDRLAAESISHLLGLEIQPGLQISLDAGRLNTLRTAFAGGTIRRACQECQWKPLCDGIAQQRFAGTRLLSVE